jgi:hypothetical protein
MRRLDRSSADGDQGDALWVLPLRAASAPTAAVMAAAVADWWRRPPAG